MPRYAIAPCQVDRYCVLLQECCIALHCTGKGSSDPDGAHESWNDKVTVDGVSEVNPVSLVPIRCDNRESKVTIRIHCFDWKQPVAFTVTNRLWKHVSCQRELRSRPREISSRVPFEVRPTFIQHLLRRYGKGCDELPRFLQTRSIIRKRFHGKRDIPCIPCILCCLPEEAPQRSGRRIDQQYMIGNDWCRLVTSLTLSGNVSNQGDLEIDSELPSLRALASK